MSLAAELAAIPRPIGRPEMDAHAYALVALADQLAELRAELGLLAGEEPAAVQRARRLLPEYQERQAEAFLRARRERERELRVKTPEFDAHADSAAARDQAYEQAFGYPGNPWTEQKKLNDANQKARLKGADPNAMPFGGVAARVAAAAENNRRLAAEAAEKER